MPRAMALAQTGLEAMRWLRDDAEINGRLTDYVRHGHVADAGLLAIRFALRCLPPVHIKPAMPLLVAPEYEYVGMGAEAMVVREQNQVYKYLTGKSQDPDILGPRLVDLHQRAQKHIGKFLLPTEVDTEKIKLFRGLSARTYVRITQPWHDARFTDPHLSPGFLRLRPEIVPELSALARGLANLFEHEGLLMDIVNDGNLEWGRFEAMSPDALHLIDGVPVDYACEDFTGVSVPFWDPGMHLEYLADFIDTHNPTLMDQLVAGGGGQSGIVAPGGTTT